MVTVTTAEAAGRRSRSRGSRRRVHRAWWVAAITFAALLAAASFRSSTGALIEPLEAEFGWSRAITSGAVTLNLVLYGLTAPFAAALMQRFGVRRVVVAALTLIAGGMGLSTLMTSAWQLYVLWGLFVGLGTGSLALVFGAIVANRWFVRRRGLMIGDSRSGCRSDGGSGAARGVALDDLLDPGRQLLHLRLVDQRPDPDALHPGGT